MGRESSVQFLFWFFNKILQKVLSLFPFLYSPLLLGYPSSSIGFVLWPCFWVFYVVQTGTGTGQLQAHCLTPTVWLSHYLLLVNAKGQAGSDGPMFPLANPLGRHPVAVLHQRLPSAAGLNCKQTLISTQTSINTWMGLESLRERTCDRCLSDTRLNC